MTRVPSTLAAAPAPGSRQLARGITATWWYTVSAVLFIELMLVGAWTGIAAAVDLSGGILLFIGLGGLLWCASTLMLLLDYRHRLDAEPGVGWLCRSSSRWATE